MKTTPGQGHIFNPAEAGCGQPFVVGPVADKTDLIQLRPYGKKSHFFLKVTTKIL